MAKVMGGKITKITYDGVDIDPATVKNFELRIPEGYDGSVSHVVCLAEVTATNDGDTAMQIQTCMTYQQVMFAMKLLNNRLAMLRKEQEV